MFKCCYCEKTSLPREIPTMVIVEIRKRDYFCGSSGWEIEKENLTCPRCVERLSKMDALVTPSEIDKSDLLADGETKELVIPIKVRR